MYIYLLGYQTICEYELIYNTCKPFNDSASAYKTVNKKCARL